MRRTTAVSAVMRKNYLERPSPQLSNWRHGAGHFLLTSSFTVWPTRLARAFGHAGGAVFAGASYYMTFLNVVIGYGIIGARYDHPIMYLLERGGGLHCIV